MISDRLATSEIKAYFVEKWSDGLANGLPNSCDPLLPIVFETAAGVYLPAVYFRNVEKIAALENNKHFAKITLSNLKTRQHTLPGGTVDQAKAMFTTNGVGIVELFFSKSYYSTNEEDLLTAIAHEMFLRKRTPNVVFRNATISRLPEEEKFYRTIVTFDYEFDTPA